MPVLSRGSASNLELGLVRDLCNAPTTCIDALFLEQLLHWTNDLFDVWRIIARLIVCCPHCLCDLRVRRLSERLYARNSGLADVSGNAAPAKCGRYSGGHPLHPPAH